MINTKIDEIKHTPTYKLLRYNFQKLESDFINEAAMSQKAEQMYEDMMDAEWRMNVYFLEQIYFTS